MTGGAAVSVSTKSGTNEFRGSAFYFRNQDNLNARQTFFSGADNPESSVDILGGTVGGPIKKNSLFFFGGWERNLEKNSRITTLTVPTAKMRTGDYSEVLAFNPNFRLYDPATGNASTGADRTQLRRTCRSRPTASTRSGRRSDRHVPAAQRAPAPTTAPRTTTSAPSSPRPTATTSTSR